MAASNQDNDWTQTLFKRGYGKNVRGGPQFMTAWNELIKPRKNTDYQAQYLYRQLQNLNADMFPSNSTPTHGNPNMRTLRLDGGEVDYLVSEDGSVVLLNWRADEMHRYRRMGGEAAGLYRAERARENWRAESAISYVGTELAAVSVSGDKLNDVADNMARVLSQGYPSQRKHLNKPGSEYTLFHVPRSVGERMSEMAEVVKDVRKFGRQSNDRVASRGGVESARALASDKASKVELRQTARATEAAKQLAAAIEVAARKGRKIKWAAEGKGVALFAAALHLLVQQERLRDGKAFNVNQRQSLYVVRPGRTRLKIIDDLRREVGMLPGEAGTHGFNDFSLADNFGGLNFLDDAWVAGRRVLETGQGFTGYAARRTFRTLMWGNIGLTAVASYGSGSWSPQDLSGYAGWVSLLLVAASSVPALSRRVGDLSVTGPEEGVDAMLANPIARRLLGRNKKP